MTKSLNLLIVLTTVLLWPYAGNTQTEASIREIDTTILTYPFSDPNPIPHVGKIYPYFTFDGYSVEATPESWKMVVLENEYIRVDITPEIGGKIWSAYDKTRNVPFIYGNDVVKFRNIAMRGPWTSGGIEFNFGIIGHTPTVSTPVDYATRKNEDGSASCFISALDLLTRTRWVVEISVPADKALFSTRVYWVNPSDVEQPYYTWMNLAVPASDDLHFIDPGTHYITHGGEAHAWPFDSIRNIDLSEYRNNAFEGSKSYHITGKHTDFFGTWYENSNDGMIHLADRDAKPGKKVFLWALSGAGQIWEKLLTDHAGQYVEVQSGRLFNQNVAHSSKTPFKQIGFPPFQSDRWTEYWFPYHGIGSVEFADKNTVWHFDKRDLRLGIDLMALSPIADTLKIYTKDNFTLEHPLELNPLATEHLVFQVRPEAVTRIEYGSTVIIPEWVNSTDLSRPLSIPPDFNQSSSYNQYLLGHDDARFRQYKSAESHIKGSLKQDSFFIPSLVEMSMLQYRKMNYDSAFNFARRALSINTYDPAANYYYGLAAEQLGKLYDALDGWEVAALTPQYRIAAWYQIAVVYFRMENWSRCQDYLNKIFKVQPWHETGIKLQLVLDRIMNKKVDKNKIKHLINLDPDNHFIAFERYLRSGEKYDKDAFQASIRNELPAQTYLEMAVWYAVKLNMVPDAIRLLEIAPRNNLIEYWLAYLSRNDNKRSAEYLSTADMGNPEFIFPFRCESLPVMVWASSKTEDWKPGYYLALISAFRGHMNFAGDILESLPGDVDFAPLYAWRSHFQDDPASQENDLRKALRLDPGNWRYTIHLADFLIRHDRLEDAEHLLEGFYPEHKLNYQVGMLLARTYLMAGKANKADEILAGIHVLPYEGAHEGRVLYRSVKLILGLDALQAGDTAIAGKFLAESKRWPESLGVGKPYNDQIDTEWEDQISAWISSALNGKKIPVDAINKLKEKILNHFFRFRETAPF